MLEISIIKIEDPGCLWGMILKASGAPVVSPRDYEDLQVQMNFYYNGLALDVKKSKLAQLKEGQVCVVFCSALKSWCRATLETLFQGVMGMQATFFLVDHGERIVVHAASVRAPLDKFLQLPFRVQRFALARIHPMRLKVFPCNETAELVPSTRWDSSATKYLHNLLKASTLVEAVLCETHAECNAIELYLTIKNLKICVNDDLVVKKFAYSRETAVTGKQNRYVDSSPVSLAWDIFKPQQILEMNGYCPVKGPVPHFLTKMDEKHDHLSRTAQLSLLASEQAQVENGKLFSGSYSCGVSDEDEFTSRDKQEKRETGKIEQTKYTESILAEQLSQKLSLIRCMKFLNPMLNSSVISKCDENAEQHDEQKQKHEDLHAHKQTDLTCLPHTVDTSTVCSPSDIPSEQKKASFFQPNTQDQVSCARLLQLLNPDPLTPDSESLDSNVACQEPSKIGILVHSRYTINPCMSLEHAPITEQFRKFLIRHKYSGPGLAESYCWPPVARGCDTVLVSRSGDDPLSYIPPLLAQLQLGLVFTSLTPNSGPIAVILCPGWEKVQFVLELLEESQAAGHLHPAAVLIGLGKNEARLAKIQNNCKLLITTPFSLVRLLEVHHFLFLRLWYLILDEANELYSRAPEQMAAILQHFQKQASREEQATCPRQLVAVGKHWSQELEAMVREHMINPCVIITAKEEAALYGGVQQTTLLCLDCNKIPVLLSCMDFSPSVPQKTLIITNLAEEVEHVYKALSNTAAFALKVHEGLTHQFEFVIEQWKKDIGPGTQVILVTTNDYMQTLDIMDATCVVHYGFPASPKLFGKRLFCMYKNLKNLSDKDRSEASSPVVRSLLLLSERNARHVSGVLRYLKRAGIPLPPELLQFAQGVQQAKEKQKSDQTLCNHLKSLGYCRDSAVCLNRHTVNRVLDCPLHPDSGIIQVLPLYIKNASVYYGRIVDQKEGSYEKLAAAINSHYTKEKLCAKDAVEGSLYAVQEDDVYHRVRVTKVPDKGAQIFSSVTAHYVDEGRIQEVKLHQLLQLPLEFQSLPAQAVEIIVCRVQPIDGEMEFNPKVTRAISLKIKGKVHQARVVMCLGNTVWVDPMVRMTQVTGLKINEYNIHAEILATGMGTTNPQHLELLKTLCQTEGSSAAIKPSESNRSESASVSLEQNTQAAEEALASTVKSDISGFISRVELATPCLNTKPCESSEKLKDAKHITLPNGDLSKALLEACEVDNQQMVRYVPQIRNDEISNNSVKDETNTKIGHTEKSGDSDAPQSFHPQIKWFQEEESVTLKMKLINPTMQKCEFFSDRVLYSAYADNRHYCVDLELHSDIVAEQCSSETKCNEPVIKLVKKERKEWKSLLKYKSVFVTYDLDYIEDEDIPASSGGRFFVDSDEDGCYVNSDSGTESD